MDEQARRYRKAQLEDIVTRKDVETMSKTRTTNAQLDSKVAYINGEYGLSLTWETRNGYKALERKEGGRTLARGTATELWNVLDAIETVLYFKERGGE